MIFLPNFLVAFASSLMLGVILVSTTRIHGYLSLDSQAGVQKLHMAPTPRVGGIAVASGLTVAYFSLPTDTQVLLCLVCISALPAFAFGLMEDLTKKISVKVRLCATIASGLIFCLLTGYQITRVDIPGLDMLLSFGILSILFTAFAIGGVANAVNIIDGVNGLASGSSIVILSGFAIVAFQSEDLELAAVCVISAGALCGFFVLNFPMGKLFLGDAGAYLAGFLLAVIAVALPQRNPELSPLIGLLALSYPVTETVVSINRRIVRRGAHPGQADRLHLHSLIYRSRAKRLAQLVGAPHLRNALTGLILLGLSMISVTLMVLFRESTFGIVTGLFCVIALYLAIYRKVAVLKPLRYRMSSASSPNSKSQRST